MARIGDFAFYGYTGLKSITIPNSVTSIGRDAFSFCTGLTSVIIPNSVTSIGTCAFEYCSGLASITIPNTVGYIEWYAFNHTPWYENLPGGLIYIGLVAYEYKGYMPENSSIVIKEGTQSIGTGAFMYCKRLTSVIIPNSVTSIGGWAFYDCKSLTNITIPNSVTNIGELAFNECTGLTSVTIGNSVNSLDNTFNNCSNLTNINALRTDPKDYNCKEAFEKGTYNKARLHVPIGCRNVYATTEPWSKFENIIDDIELTGIEDVIADSNTETNKQITDYYNLQGQRTTRLQRGVNIIRYSDGTMKKVLVK